MGSPPKNTTTEQKLPDWMENAMTSNNYPTGGVMGMLFDRFGPNANQNYSDLGGPLLQQSNRTDLYNLGATNLAGQAAGPNPFANQANALYGQSAGTAGQGLRGMAAEAAGQYLGGNPYMNQALGRASRDIQSNFQNAVGESNAMFQQAGGRDSSGNVAAYADAAQRSLADPLTELYGQAQMLNYETERGRQSAANAALAGQASGLMSNAGAMRQMNFMDDQALMELGLSQQELNDLNAQRAFQNQMAGFEWDNNAVNRLINPMALAARGQGSTTATMPSNTMANVGHGLQGAGAAAGGAAALKTAFA